MFNKKTKTTEQEAARAYLSFIFAETEKAWPNLYEDLKAGVMLELLNTLERPGFAVEDERQAMYDLALAVIAVNTQALKNLFPEKDARRICQSVLRLLDVPGLNSYATDELARYGEAFESADNISAVAERLLHRWLGKNISNYQVVVDGKESGIPSPLVIQYVSVMITPLCISWSWKTFRDNYAIVPIASIDLEELKSGFLGKPYKLLVQQHVKRGNAQFIMGAIDGTKRMLPPGATNHLVDFIDRWNRQAYDASFWMRDSAKVLSDVIEEARTSLSEAGITTDEETLFDVFQLVTLTFALNASLQPELRKFAGIKKGLFS